MVVKIVRVVMGSTVAMVGMVLIIILAAEGRNEARHGTEDG